MNREDKLRVLKAIKEPLVSLTGFYDGVTCEYISSRGCGGFELVEISDLCEYDYNSVDRTWDQMLDNELDEWIDLLESGDFNPIQPEPSDANEVEHDKRSDEKLSN